MRAGAGGGPSPYPSRSGGAGMAPARAARPEPRRRPPPSRRPRHPLDASHRRDVITAGRLRAGLPPPPRPITIPIGSPAPLHWRTALSLRTGVPGLPWERGRGEGADTALGTRPLRETNCKSVINYIKNHLLNVNLLKTEEDRNMPERHIKRTVTY